MMDLKEIARTLSTKLQRARLTEAQVVQLLDVAFRSSLSTDEGRQTRCVLSISHEESHLQGPSHHQLPFSSPVPLTPELLRRLAPAADPLSGGISISTLNGMLSITGFFSRPHRGTAFEAIEVIIQGPGSILISQDGCEIVQIAQGRASWFLLGANEAALGGLLASLSTTTARATMARVTRTTVLTMLARRIARAGHGGALFVVPQKVEAAGVLPLRFPVRDANTLRIALSRVHSAQRHCRQDPNGSRLSAQLYARELESAMDLVASLALVDGALVLDDRLEVRSFATFVQLSETLPETVDAIEIGGPVVIGRQERTSEIGGARHRSALSFCLAQPSWALAFVASQDGRAAAFIKNKVGVVRMFRPISFHWRHNSIFET